MLCVYRRAQETDIPYPLCDCGKTDSHTCTPRQGRMQRGPLWGSSDLPRTTAGKPLTTTLWHSQASHTTFNSASVRYSHARSRGSPDGPYQRKATHLTVTVSVIKELRNAGGTPLREKQHRIQQQGCTVMRNIQSGVRQPSRLQLQRRTTEATPVTSPYCGLPPE